MLKAGAPPYGWLGPRCLGHLLLLSHAHEKRAELKPSGHKSLSLRDAGIADSKLPCCTTVPSLIFLLPKKFLLLRVVYLKGSYRERNLSFAGSIPKWLPQPRLGWAEARTEAISFLWVFHGGRGAPALQLSSTAFPGT